jgi:hypothetical protein
VGLLFPIRHPLRNYQQGWGTNTPDRRASAYAVI